MCPQTMNILDINSIFDDVEKSPKIYLFDSQFLPDVTISDYLKRIVQYSNCSTEVIIQSLIHISRISRDKSQISVNSISIHRLLLTAILCTAKFFDDVYFNNISFSKMGGIPLNELNSLEIEFLALINFEFLIDYDNYIGFYNTMFRNDLHNFCNCHVGLVPRYNN